MNARLTNYIENNESPEMKAQTICKKAIFEVQIKMEELLNELEERKMITEIKMEVEVYNRGYQFRYDFKPLIDPRLEKYGKFGRSFLFGMTPSIWVQPGSFFNSYIKDEKYATMESACFYSEKETQHINNHRIQTTQDVKNFAADFVNRNTHRINNVRNNLKKLS